MNPVFLKELKKISYANTEVLGERSFLLMPLWDGKEWHQWTQKGDGTLIKMKISDVVRSNYVSKQSASKDDLWIPFIDFMWQRANWPEIYPLLVALSNAFHNLGTSITKLKHFFYAREEIGNDSILPFAATELEYFAIIARTIFDLLQETISTLWNGRIQLIDPEAEALRKKHKLPDTFSKMVLNNKIDMKTEEQLIEKYALPPILAKEYIKHAAFFISIRSIRNRIVHGGSGISTVFVTEKGFCVLPKDRIFSSFDIWEKSHWYNDNIASLLPWITYIVFNTIGACNDIMGSFSRQVEFPPEIAPGYRVFIRDHTSDAFLDLLKVHKGEMVWWDNKEKSEK